MGNWVIGYWVLGIGYKNLKVRKNIELLSLVEYLLWAELILAAFLFIPKTGNFRKQVGAE